MGISLRLQEERKRLGLTQEAAAARLGATKRSVINWEGGAALPGAELLARYAELGADVLYILTGQRERLQPHIASEQVLIDSYRRCSTEAQQNLIQTAALFATGSDERLNDYRGIPKPNSAPMPSAEEANAVTKLPTKPARKRPTKSDK